MNQLRELNSDLIHQQNQCFIITNNQQFQTKRTMFDTTRLAPFWLPDKSMKSYFYGWNRLSSPSMSHDNCVNIQKKGNEELKFQILLPFFCIFTVFYKNDYFSMILYQKFRNQRSKWSTNQWKSLRKLLIFEFFIFNSCYYPMRKAYHLSAQKQWKFYVSNIFNYYYKNKQKRIFIFLLTRILLRVQPSHQRKHSFYFITLLNFSFLVI